MNRYRKAIVAVVGVGALLALRIYEIEMIGIDAVVMETIVSALTAFGVYQVPNDG